MAKNVTGQVDDATHLALQKEYAEKGYNSLNAYIVDILKNRHSILQSKTSQTPQKEKVGMAEYVIKRAWQIARISREKLLEGFQQ
jgi:hypothetical protein